MSRILSEEPDENGLYRKYVVDVRKADGEPTDPDAEYLVLRLDTDAAARKAALVYADAVEDEMPKFADDIRTWVGIIEDEI